MFVHYASVSNRIFVDDLRSTPIVWRASISFCTANSADENGGWGGGVAWVYSTVLELKSDQYCIIP